MENCRMWNMWSQSIIYVQGRASQNNYNGDSQLPAFSKWYNMPIMIVCSEQHYIVARVYLIVAIVTISCSYSRLKFLTVWPTRKIKQNATSFQATIPKLQMYRWLLRSIYWNISKINLMPERSPYGVLLSPTQPTNTRSIITSHHLPDSPLWQ